MLGPLIEYRTGAGKSFQIATYIPSLTMTRVWRMTKLSGKRRQFIEGNQDENKDHFGCVTHVREFKLHSKGLRSS